MIPQEAIDAHANRVQSLSLWLKDEIVKSTDAVTAEVSQYLLNGLTLSEGVVEQSPDNARIILGIEDAFEAALRKSDYYPALLSFVDTFVDQIDEFASFYSYSQDAFELPPVALSDDDKDVLAIQAAAAVAALEGHTFSVTSSLRSKCAHLLGESSVSELIKEVSEGTRRMNGVEQIAKAQLILFYRTIGTLVYRKLEESGKVFKYSLVGPTGGKRRGFCVDLMKSLPKTKKEIDALDNGQVESVFDNCGGFFCQHWWAIVEVAG